MPKDKIEFEEKADKWWESRWAFVMAIALPLIAVMTSYTLLQINDTRQQDAIATLQSQQTLFQQGDFKDLTARVMEEQTAIEQLIVQVTQLQTIINERIPPK